MIVLNHCPFQKHQKPTIAVAADLKMSNQAKPAGNRSYYAIGGPLFTYTASHFIRTTCSVAKKGDYMTLNVTRLVPDGLVWSISVAADTGIFMHLYGLPRRVPRTEKIQ